MKQDSKDYTDTCSHIRERGSVPYLGMAKDSDNDTDHNTVHEMNYKFLVYMD